MSKITKEQAIQLAESGWWKDRPAIEVARLQLNERLLCMDFGDFHGAVEKALGRPVWTHEFADSERLLRELDGSEPTPSEPAQHASDSLAALALSMGKDPDAATIVIREDT